MSSNPSGYQKFFSEARKTSTQSQKSSTLTPEQQVLRQLTEQANARKIQKKSRRRPPPPVFASLLLLVAVSAGLAGVIYPHALDEIPGIESIKKINIGFFGHASAKEETAPSAQTSAPAKKASTPAESALVQKLEDSSSGGEKSEDKSVDLRQWTTEELSFFNKLNERKVELDRREAELAKLEEDLQSQKVGIEAKIKQLETMRNEISQTLKDRVEQDQEKVAKLVDVYSNMKPASASRVIETLNEDLAVTILDRMKKKNAAEILNMMSSAKARKLSEMLTGYRQPASEAKESSGEVESKK